MNFKKLTPALFAFILSVAPALAQLPRLDDTKLTNHSLVATTKSPTYRQWQTTNFIDKITYSQNEMVISYSYRSSGSAVIYPPNEVLAWLLKDQNGNVYKVKAVKNLKNNGKLISAEVKSQTHISSYNELDGEYIFEELNLTCELHFDRLPANVNKVDLVEGLGRETFSNHFNAFDIEIQQPQNLKENEIVEQTLAMLPHVETEALVEWEWSDENEHMLTYIEENDAYLNVPPPPPPPPAPEYDENGGPQVDWAEFEANTFEEELITSAYELSEKIKTDKNPKFRQWQEGYNITKIDYHQNEMVITFQNVSKNYISSIFYGPEGQHTWFLKDKNGNIYNMKALNNLQHNGKTAAEGVLTEFHINSDWNDERKKEVATCQIVFDRLPADVKVVDLIEGAGRETWENHFNVFDIKLKTFETKTEKVETPEPAVEPVIAAQNNPQNGIEAVAVSANYSLFPNPNKGTFFLTNNNKTQNDATVQVLDLTGKLLFTQHNVVLQEKNSQSFQVTNLPAGQYMVRISHSDKTTESLRMVVVE